MELFKVEIVRTLEQLGHNLMIELPPDEIVNLSQILPSYLTLP